MNEAPLPRRSLLDARPSEVAFADPIADAVNIPFDEIPMRQHELPPKSQIVRLAADPLWSPRAARWLSEGGRRYDLAAYAATKHLEPGRLWEPHPLTILAGQNLDPGRCLDLGCGSGRDAIYLAAQGWNVDAVDRLSDAIERGRLSADRLLDNRASRIAWHVQEAGAFALSVPVDLVLMILFLDRDAISKAMDSMTPGGIFALECFTPTNRVQRGKPHAIDLTMDLAEAHRLFAGFEPIVAEEAWRDDRHTLRWMARKRG